MTVQLDPASAAAAAPLRRRRPLETIGGRDLLDRPTLRERLLQGHVAVTLVRAPAGSGKTVLLAQAWQALQEGVEPALWVALGRSDRKPARLLAHLREVLAAGGMALPPLEEDDPLSAGAELADRLASSEHRCTLFVDDLQWLEGSPALQVVQGLAQGVSDRLRLVLASRVGPTLPLARLRAQGQLREVTGADLAFTEGQSTALLAQFGCDWPQAWCTELHRRSEGWVTGLVLLGQCLAQGPQQQGHQRLVQCTGELPALAEYFDEEVLQPLAAAGALLPGFLRQVSVLDELSAGLCEAVTLRPDSPAMLAQSVERGALLAATDAQAQWFRLNGLFAQHLRRRLRESTAPALMQALHQRASAWLEAERRFIGAFEQAMLAGDPVRAATLFEERILDAWCAGASDAQRVEVLTLAARIPPGIKHRFPRVLLLEAWRRITYWQFEGAQELLDLTRRRLDAGDLPDDAADQGSLGSVRGLLAHGDTMLAMARDEPVAAGRQAEQLLRDYPDANPYMKGTVYTCLLVARREQFQLGEVERLAALADDYIARAGLGPGVVFAEATIAPAYLMLGRTETALRRLGRALSLAEQFGGGAGPLGALVALPLAEVHHERNELQQAQALVDQYLVHGTLYGFVDQLVAGWCVAARLQHLQGRTAAAEATLAEAIARARRHGFERLRWAAAGESVRLMLAEGRVDDAARLVGEHGLGDEPRALLPGAGVTTHDEARASAWARIALARHQLAEAHTVIRHWRNHLEAAGAVRPLLRWELLAAHHALLSGDGRAAQRLLRRALALALPGRLLRPILDEGAWLECLLRKQGDVPAGRDLRVDAFAAELLAGFDAQQGRRKAISTASLSDHPGVYGSLTQRETEILSLVAGGLLNREIGDRLGMTEGSVKWYLQRIYDKLGVRRRSQAIDRALKMGIISG